MAFTLGDIAFRHIGDDGRDQSVAKLSRDAARGFVHNEVVFPGHHVRTVLFGAAGRNDQRSLAGFDRVADLDPGHALRFDLGSPGGAGEKPSSAKCAETMD